MPRISMSAKLNDSSRLSIVDTSEYKEIYLDVEHIVPAEENFYPLTEIEELADDMLERGQLQPLLIGRVDTNWQQDTGGELPLCSIMSEGIREKRGVLQRKWTK